MNEFYSMIFFLFGFEEGCRLLIGLVTNVSKINRNHPER